MQLYIDGYFDSAVMAQYTNLLYLALCRASRDDTNVAQSIVIARFIIPYFM